MEMEMGVGVCNALDGLLSHYLNTIDAGASKDTPAVVIAEHILSITSKWVLDVKRRRNRATPIYRLPTEILLTIFQLCVPPDPFQRYEKYGVDGSRFHPVETDHYVCILTLCGVSFDWACLIRDTPAFWVYTRSRDHRELTDLILERSRNSLLWVEYNVESGVGLYRAKSLDEYIMAIRRESHRCRTLVLRPRQPALVSGQLDVEVLGEAPFPELSHLFIHIPRHASTPLPYFFKCGRPPLKYLQVSGTGAGLQWDQWSPQPKLEVLRLGSTRSEELILGYLQIRGIINTSPSLKTLEIRSALITDLPPIEAPGPSSSSMPVLETLNLTWVEPVQTISMLLSNVTLHSNAVVSTSFPFHGRNIILSTEAVCSIIGSLRQDLCSSTRPACPTPLSITTASGVANGAIDIYYTGDTFQISLWDRPGDGSRIDEVVRSLDPELHGTPTVLRLQLESPTNVLLHSLSNRLSSVEDLTMAADHTSILEILGHPLDTPTAGWLFPKMKRLCLFIGTDHPSQDVAQAYPAMFTLLCKVAEARSTASGTGENVATLERIRLTGRAKIQKRDIERLEALVPEVIIATG
ncbi:hypothetical protein FRB99_007232 [Tulasnella sp. 403]|nr:hypothetical protein FRB99_007232 [Tulasnella sp. 403]